MSESAPFTLLARVLHWMMAAMILAMLFIGVGMVASLTDYRWLVSIHRPLGVAILALAAVRLLNRLVKPPPPLPSDMPPMLKWAAHGSHVALYVLMIATPLVGWAMLSAAGYPIVMFGAWTLPPILGRDTGLHAQLRPAHTVLAFALFATFLAHLGAALAHALIFRDGVFESMATLRPTHRSPHRSSRRSPPPG